ncbi:hypothetical protein Bca52824_014457 [Brassica carinata]|uniref:Uncharacterized protein n=1 Tax=Brassica carinata TaxID=52824 RepID=A0A8X7W139_BRACI|nr:hypothetical protein Bca52824_014457 [Brassica carinata]
MHDYEEDLEEEAGYDGYYSDDGGSENEELPPKEELEYLELRQKTKDSIRKKWSHDVLSIAKRILEAEDSARNLDASVKDSDATDLEVVTSGPMGDPIV